MKHRNHLIFKCSCSLICILTLTCASVATAADPAAMRWIPPGQFTMGTDDVNSMRNERPAHLVKLNGFWMDEHDVTNAEFRKFIQATHYVTTAEKSIDWDEMKKQVAPRHAQAAG